MQKKIKHQIIKIKGSGENLELDYTKLRILNLVVGAVADETNRCVISLLQENPTLFVGQIHKKLKIKLRQPGLKQPTVSRHLAVLRKAGICISEKRGQFRYYSLVLKKLEDIVELVNSFAKKTKKK